jgi:amino acid transporter
MAFQGFQLLTYDYDDMRRPQRTLQRAFRWAIVTTTVTYVLITVAAVLIVGTQEIVANRETALNAMGRSALGAAGLYTMIAVAGLATITAINATLFATARLARTASLEAGLWLKRKSGPPPLRPFLIVLSLLAVFLAALGGVQDLIRWASFLFLLVFAGVNFMALRQRADHRTVSLFGLLATLTFVCVLVAYRLA